MALIRAILLFFAICLQASGAELLVFSADWCGACRRFHQDHERDPDMISVPMRTIGDRESMRKYRIRSLPTFVLVENGREIRRTVGYGGPVALKEWLAGH